jgi:hypothetical protein
MKSKLLIGLLTMGLFLYSFVEKNNELTQLRFRIPKLMQEIKLIEEKNSHLRFQIEQFTSPQNLMLLAQDPTYSHLKFPPFSEVVTLNEGLALMDRPVPGTKPTEQPAKVSLASAQ